MAHHQNETVSDPQHDTSYTGQIATLRAQLSEMTGERDRLRESVRALTHWATREDIGMGDIQDMPDSHPYEVVWSFDDALTDFTAGQVKRALAVLASTSQDSGTPDTASGDKS